MICHVFWKSTWAVGCCEVVRSVSVGGRLSSGFRRLRGWFWGLRGRFWGLVELTCRWRLLDCSCWLVKMYLKFFGHNVIHELRQNCSGTIDAFDDIMVYEFIAASFKLHMSVRSLVRLVPEADLSRLRTVFKKIPEICYLTWAVLASSLKSEKGSLDLRFREGEARGETFRDRLATGLLLPLREAPAVRTGH